MEIGIPQEVLIETGLNAAGFLIASLLLLLLHSLFFKRRHKSMVAPSGQISEPIVDQRDRGQEAKITEPQEYKEDPIEFVSLSGAALKRNRPSRTNSRTNRNKRKDSRMEVLNLARQLSDRSKNSPEFVSKSLEEKEIVPITNRKSQFSTAGRK